MRALTIMQPYASLIASGEKWVENRGWNAGYRGPLAIHAGQGLRYLDREEIKCYPTGCIIATATLAACVVREVLQKFWADEKTRDDLVPGCNVTWRQVMDHQYTEGPFCWILENVQKIDPVPIKGQQGLWVPGAFEARSFNAKVEE